MKLNHIVTAKDFDRKFIDQILLSAKKIKSSKKSLEILRGKIMTTLFYEPSTRTRLSFESSMLRLGGSVISTENAKEFSSAVKGETLEDTIRIVGGYCDVIVLRHYQAGASKIAAQFSKVPLINAGDGNDEHPSQALLDLFTIFSKFNQKEKINVLMIGDLLNGRTIHSLSYMLSLYPNISLSFVSPKALSIPKDLREHLASVKANFVETEEMDPMLKDADVVYQTRIQKERFESESQYTKYFGRYVIDESNINSVKQKAVIMHPLPRVNEISPKIDSDSRAIYFEQAHNGVFVRMALLLYLFDKQNQIPG